MNSPVLNLSLYRTREHKKATDKNIRTETAVPKKNGNGQEETHLHETQKDISPERRCSSRTFRYGYLVTT